MENPNSYVFISYSSKNILQADAVRNLLAEQGIKSWMASHDIPAGAKYAHVIDEAIEKSSCVLLLLTEDAQNSPHVDREIERAISYKKEIIPVRLDGCALNAGFRYYVGNCQIIDVTAVKATNAQMQMVIHRLRQINPVETDAFLLFEEHLNKWLDQPKIYTVNPERIQRLKALYRKLEALLEKEGYSAEDYSITIEPDMLGLGDVTVSFVGFDITVCDISAFCEIIREFANFEIYPLKDEKLRFSGVFRKVANISLKKDE